MKDKPGSFPALTCIIGKLTIVWYTQICSPIIDDYPAILPVFHKIDRLKCIRKFQQFLTTRQVARFESQIILLRLEHYFRSLQGLGQKSYLLLVSLSSSTIKMPSSDYQDGCPTIDHLWDSIYFLLGRVQQFNLSFNT